MPFFCDLFDVYDASKEADKDGFLNAPELVPYTQTLFYDEIKSTGQDSYGKQNYKPLFTCPWKGDASGKSVAMELEWSGQINGLGEIKDSLAARQLGTEVGIRRNKIIQARMLIEELGKGGVEDAKRLGILEGKFGDLLRNVLSDKHYKQLNTVLNATENEYKKWVENFRKAVGAELSEEENKLKSSGGVNYDGGANANIDSGQEGMPGEYIVDSNNIKVTLNGITVRVHDRYSENLSIEKSIVCKSSSVDEAKRCLKLLSSYLAIVAPQFAYREVQTGKENKFSTLGVIFTPPNNFDISTAGTTSTNGAKVSDLSSEKYDFNLFNYRGEFQLRQGYNIYRNLIPKEVIVSSSPDLILLDGDPFKKDPSVKGKNGSNNTGKPSWVDTRPKIGEDAAERIMDTWRATGFCKQITLFKKQGNIPEKKGWLFPQWFNLRVSLGYAQPFDGITGTQQLFCLSDKCVKAGT